MAFVNKFKSGNTTNEVPVGVNLAHTSFGYAKNQQYAGIQPTKGIKH